jgi:hypothetical protein
MGKDFTLKELGLKRTPTGYGVFIQHEKKRLSEIGDQTRRRITGKQTLSWEPKRAPELWRRLGSDGQAPFKATAARLLAELRAHAKILAQRKRNGFAIEEDVSGAGLTAPQIENVSGAGLTAPLLEVNMGNFLWQDSHDCMPRCITFPAYGDADKDHMFLGQGAYGTVVKCREAQTLEEFALKITKVRGNTTDDMVEAFAVCLREYEMLRMCIHPNVVRALAYLQNVDLRQVGLLLALADVSLKNLIQRKGNTKFETPTVEGRVAAALQLCRGLAYTHHCDVVHCDVKPANVLVRFGSEGVGRIEGSRIMLADFGLSRTKAEAQQGDHRDMINSLPYRPPELLVKRNERVVFAGEVDVWALGATAFEIAAYGNAKGPRIMMAHYFLQRGAACQLELLAARDLALARLAPDDTLLKRLVAHCAVAIAHRPSAEVAMQDLRHRMTLKGM